MLGQPALGDFHPVIHPKVPDWRTSERFTRTEQLLALTDQELAEVDPLAANLLVAQEMPEVGPLHILRYQQTLNAWADDFRARCLPKWEQTYHRSPQDFGNRLTMFRLGMLTQYLDQVCNVRYREDLKDDGPPGNPDAAVLYTNAADVMLHGVIDSREGTCGSLAALHLAMAWRLGWPVSLASVGAHCVVRYDDGQAVYNLEATATGLGGWLVQDDDHYIQTHRLPHKALATGSDLRALTPRERLGLFIGLRARVYENTGRPVEAEQDYLLARSLFPNNRYLYFAQMQASLQESDRLFAVGERGHVSETVGWLTELCRLHGWPILVKELRTIDPTKAVQPHEPQQASTSKAQNLDEALASIDLGL